MVVINVEVPEKISNKFIWMKVVSYEDILNAESDLHYSFEKKVSLEEVSSFLWKHISSKKKNVC